MMRPEQAARSTSSARVSGHRASPHRASPHRASPLCASAILLLAAFVIGCRSASAPSTLLRNSPSQAAPPALLGDFVDDYQGSYSISNTAWRHGTRLTYEIVAWYPDSQFVIARNAATNPREQGLWTRIDWMTLDGMPPFTWAYCLSAYKAPTQDSAMRTRVAQRDTPRTGCNGFPFSRMKRP